VNPLLASHRLLTVAPLALAFSSLIEAQAVLVVDPGSGAHVDLLEVFPTTAPPPRVSRLPPGSVLGSGHRRRSPAGTDATRSDLSLYETVLVGAQGDDDNGQVLARTGRYACS